MAFNLKPDPRVRAALHGLKLLRLTAVLSSLLPAGSLWAHVEPGTEPGSVHAHNHAVQTGSGAYPSQTVPGWGELPGGQPIGPTHGGVVVDPEDGRFFVSTDAEHSILVYESDGRLVASIAPQCRGFHAMDIARENEKSVIYGAQLQDTLLDLDGNILAHLGDNPDQKQWANFRVEVGAVKAGLFTAPHGLSFDPNGNIYVQDWNASGRLTKLTRRSE